ncbi:MazG family protein [Vallicoccus soli]|uniref:MazG family protein n=1 Tax=Vallicoccus soli TaxID=2339232 RepID=UPI001C499927|nr:MazG family protein [Vallicoccus soli]
MLARAAGDPQAAAVRAAGVAVQDAHDLPDARLAARLAQEAERHVVVLLPGPAGDPAADGLAEALAAELTRRSSAGAPVPEVELVPASWDVPGARLLDLVAVMDRLRSPGGCPWDAEQTHESLLRYLVEEAYEVVEAVEHGDAADLREELGDLLLQVVFHARVAEERAEAPFGVDDVAAGIVDKLVRRHPHVFGPEDGADAGPDAGPASTAADVEASWEVLKAREKRRASALEGVPAALPALHRAASLLERVRRRGVDAPAPALPAGVALPAGGDAALGDLLLALVDAAVGAGLDPEAALRGALARWSERVRAAEGAAAEAGAAPTGEADAPGP